jgi:hypothetical protein
MLDGDPDASPIPDVPRRTAMSSSLLLVACLGAVLGACTTGSSKATPNSSPPTSAWAPTSPPATSAAPTPLASLYLRILGPADAASGKFFTALKALPATATGADAEKSALPAADAIERANRQLRGVKWPGKLGRDIPALVSANEALVIDLRSLGPQKSVTTGAWTTRFERDVRAVFNRATAVQTDFRG